MAKSGHKAKRDLAPAGRTYKLIELVGTSPDSYEDAIQRAIGDASRTIRGLAWYEVAELRGRIEDGRAVEFQVKLKIGFRVIDGERD